MRDGAAELVTEVAELVRARNAIDEKLTAFTNRPVVAGHLGEWLAAQIFEILLEPIAVTPAIDGHFSSGPLKGKTVNVKWYGKREGMIDMTSSDVLDYYLVLTGPSSASGASASDTRPLRIDACYLFDAQRLLQWQITRGVKVGVAASVPAAEWNAAELYPSNRGGLLDLEPEQVALLRLFGD